MIYSINNSCCQNRFIQLLLILLIEWTVSRNFRVYRWVFKHRIWSHRPLYLQTFGPHARLQSYPLHQVVREFRYGQQHLIPRKSRIVITNNILYFSPEPFFPWPSVVVALGSQQPYLAPERELLDTLLTHFVNWSDQAIKKFVKFCPPFSDMPATCALSSFVLGICKTEAWDSAKKWSWPEIGPERKSSPGHHC